MLRWKMGENASSIFKKFGNNNPILNPTQPDQEPKTQNPVAIQYWGLEKLPIWLVNLFDDSGLGSMPGK